ncbi:hypothetical protein [Mesorhizobium sp. NZP2077]|uniref:hypothetical protein n=1 Tax=Mesorhizobium sp. NZP2077 TaxID=2483404 RepID=UPI001FF04D93|nr:hypothetical protein [Mesorhizobium sp. NZP2077]
MSRVENPYDNAKAESFMETLKQEEVQGLTYKDAADATNGSEPSSISSTTSNGCIRRSTI